MSEPSEAPGSASAGVRRRQLALIHAAKKHLDLDDTTYRAVLFNLTKKDSAAKLTLAERRTVIDWFRARGFKSQTSRRLGGEMAKIVDQARQGGASAQERMILGLWDELKRLGAFRFGADARLDTFLHRQGYKVSHPRFLTPEEASKVIEALKGWRDRVKARKDLE